MIVGRVSGVVVGFTFCTLIAVAAGGERSFRTFSNRMVEVDRTGLTFGRVEPGVFAVDGSLDLGEFLGSDGTSASWQVNLYSISFDINQNGVFYESDDAIFETMPWPNVTRTFSDYRPPSELVELDLEHERALHPTLSDAQIEQIYDPVPRLYASTDGAWQLFGGQSLSHIDAPNGSQRGLLARGTFVGDYTWPDSFTQTEGMGPGFILSSPLTLELAELLRGDLDKNRSVDFADFLAFAASFGRPCDDCREDLDRNGIVDFADFLVLSDNFGATLGGDLVAVPELSTNSWVAIGFFFLLGCRKRSWRVMR